MKLDAKVGIITRTKNRPIMLKRAIESVCSQTYQDWIMVIVNDGGDFQTVDDIVIQYKEKLGNRVKVIHNDYSLGMEAASNKGVTSINSEYLIIHDDDDSLVPEFLEKTTSFLSENTMYEGVATSVTKIFEEIVGKEIITSHTEHFNAGVRSISLADIASFNKIPPISFIYRKKVHDHIGLYNDQLRVLGDWDFLLRFLKHFDIYKMNEILAYYHIRGSSTDQYGNTVYAGLEEHYHTDALIRNKFLREDLENGRLGMGFLMNASIIVGSNPLYQSTCVDTNIFYNIVKQLTYSNISKISIYASGSYARDLARTLDFNKITVDSFIDSNSALWGTTIDDIPVVSIHEAVERGCNNIIIGSITYFDQIAKTIKTELSGKNISYRVFW